MQETITTCQGEYNVRLIVNTVNGNCRDTITKTRQVRAQGAYAEIAYLGDNEICRGTDVVFRLINKTVNLNDVRWAPSDGNELTNDTTTTFVYTYHKARIIDQSHLSLIQLSMMMILSV